jgi:putative ABC transport system permease protein
MLIVVRERTREIGIKRAIGATPLSIVLQIMMEALFITLTSGYLGMVCGIALLDFAAANIPTDEDSMFINPAVNIATAMKAVGVLVFAGLLAGFLPARKAVSVAPVEALRSE